MGKSLIGFLVGVIVTTFTFVLFDVSPESFESETTRAAAVDPSPPQAGNQSLSGGDDSPGQSGERVADVAEAIADTPDARSPAVDQTAWEAELRRQFEQARLVLGEDAVRMVGQTSIELVKLELARQLEGMPIVSPTPLPPAFDWMAGHPYVDLFHEQFQREYIDSVWATPTQADLERLVYDRPEIVAKYGAPTIRCHTTRCEVIFVASGEWDSAGDDIWELRNAALDRMPDVFDCEAGDCWAEARTDGGMTSVFWGLVRKQQ
ncbi:MAG: hypothetical protein R3284_11660 [Rubricoccaceae bacterium]|nr:hypothetical protein [Rubricoccaceae bacterium]